MASVPDRPKAAGLTAVALSCSATLFYFGTGLAPVPVLTWLAPLPVLLLAARVSGRVAIAAAFFAFLLGTANSWDYQLHSHDEAMFPVGAGIDLGMSLTFTLAVGVFRALARRRLGVLAAVATPAVWTGVLYLVSLNPLGIMGTFAEAQGDVPVVLQTASVAGMWGVEFLVLFAPAAFAALLLPGLPAAARLRTAAIGVVVLGLAFGAGGLRLSDEDTAGASQRLAVLAPNRHQWAPAVDTPAGRDLVAAYVREIGSLPEGVATVVLPEAAFGATEAEPPGVVGPLREVAKARGVRIIAGLQYRLGASAFNTALIIPADGGATRAYLKQHDRVAVAGHDLVFLPGGPVPTGVEICADLDFPDPARAYAAAGARVLAVPASDEDANGRQHSRTALLRGVENGEAVGWAAQNGTELIADGYGRVLAEGHTAGATGFTVLVHDVPAGPGATPYTRFGAWFAWLCLALAATALIRIPLRPVSSPIRRPSAAAPAPAASR